MKPIRIIARLFASVALCATQCAWCQDITLIPNDDRYLLLEYQNHSEKFALRDTEPVLRIFGSGRVELYRPVYFTDPGRFEFRVGRDELERLLALFSPGLLATDSIELAVRADQAARDDVQSGRFSYTSESSVSQVMIRLTVDDERIYQFNNLQYRSDRHPQLVDLASLAEVEQQLVELTQRPGRKRIGEAKSVDQLIPKRVVDP